ncbi:MAG: S41 family peptidase [Bacteroidales bacterium]|nr:S41 family peptidase [Bacteroidales bacterium]
MKYRIITFLLCLATVLGVKAQELRKSVQQMQQVLTAIQYLYVDTANVEKLSEAGIRAMLKELDPHSTYADAAEVKAMSENLGGNFQGIGIRYSIETDTVYVISTVVGGPSEKVGIIAGDRVITVNDTVIAGKKLTTTDIQRYLRGPKGTEVKLGVMREGEKKLITFNIIRDDIPVYSIDAAYMATPTIGYIKVSRFAATTPEEIADALDKLTAQGLKDLIIDLQDNGGGYLQSAVEMANFFIPADKMIVYTKGRNEGAREYKTSECKKFPGKLIVLIDEESASASEIFAGAIQDLDRGIIVGRRSFGKGLVQRPLELAGGGMVKLTVAHYYTPSGRCIQKPYTKGDNEAYRKELLDRYMHGEYLSADSIHFADTLKYHTENGRTVYGGGGIMPDVFVPLDTTKLSPNHRILIARGIVNKFILEYFRDNQKRLKSKYKTFEAYDKNFEISDKIIDQLCDRARKDSVELDSTDVLYDNNLLKIQVKANIAADLFETGTFSQIMNRNNKIYAAGMDIISNEDKYRRFLQKTEQ